MPELLSKKFNVHTAQQFKEGFDESDPSNMYLFYSRIQPWETETSPATLTDTLVTDRETWRGMTALKKISNNNITLSVDKNDWVANTVYTEYSDRNPNLADSNFFVITSNNEVYKCLFNANSAKSTIIPTGRSTSVITTSDGYKWKFMYDVSDADMNRFGGLNHIPVKTLITNDGSAQFQVQQAAANGSVPIYEVTNGGSGYLENKGTIVGVTNTTAITIANTASGTDSVYNGSALYISSGAGAGQQSIVTAYNASSKLLTVNTAFAVSPNTSSTYHIGPRINIVGDGNGAEAYANVVSGAVSKITAINEGSSYSRARVVISANPSFGANAAAVTYLPDVGGHGADPVNELFGKNVTLNIEVEGAEGGFFPANNQFRVYGIIKDPTVLSTGSVATDLRYNQTLRLGVSSVSGTFAEDEFVSGGSSGARGRIVYFANSNLASTEGTLFLAYSSGYFSNSETVTANSTGITATVTSITRPDLTPFSGRILFTVTLQPVERVDAQTENFTITAKF
jgi:hypothetical protein